MNTKADNVLLDAALALQFDSDAGNGLTVRQYLHALLTTLWADGEGFSGKRPFGNRGWDYELYTPLVSAGYIPGEIDEDGDIVDVDSDAGRDFVLRLIDRAILPEQQA